MSHTGWTVGLLLALTGSFSSVRMAEAQVADEAGQGGRSASSVVAAGSTAIREAPRVLKPGDHGVGRRVGTLEWTDIDGRPGRWEAEAGPPRFLVVAMTSSSCPLSRKYLPVLARLAEAYRTRGVDFLLVAPTATDDVQDLREWMTRHEVTVACLRDIDGAVTRQVGATTTTDVVVLDRAGTVAYHGAIDDQYGLGYARDAARRRYLIDALESLLAGRRPEFQATAAPGCVLERTAPATTAGVAASYHNRISRIVQAHCAECHHAAGLAPFPLTTYEEMVAHKGMIRQVVERGVMPPWFAEPVAAGQPSKWSNDRSLATADRAELLAWLDAGLPAGDPREAPVASRTPGKWRIGEPDLVVQLPRAVSVKAEGTMPYQNLTVETNLEEERWVQALEVRPTAREVVHHVLVFVQGARGAGGEDDERRGFFAAYVPGNSAFEYPAGFAKRLPKGARLLFQLHYTPNGAATSDQTQLALRFAQEPPRHEVQAIGIANTRLRIPPHADHHAERATLRVPSDVMVLAFMPHMHLRGKAFRYEARFPDGRTETLLDIPRYDFNWQLQYRLVEPLAIAAGTTIEATGWFDNSANNPANPDPEKTVRWGPQTFDEMLLGYVEYYVPDSADGPSLRGANVRGEVAERVRSRVYETLFRRADANGDGQLSLEEAQRAFGHTGQYKGRPELLERNYRFLDKDSDGHVTADEFEHVRDLGAR